MAYGWDEKGVCRKLRPMDEREQRQSLRAFELSGIWRVMYMPIGHEQKVKCEEYIEYRCNNDLV